MNAPIEVSKAVFGICDLHMKAAKWEQMRAGSAISLAGKAIGCRVEKILPMIVKADTGCEMNGWEDALKIARMSATALGISREWMAAHQGEPSQIQALVMQKRAELFKEAC